MIGSLAKQGSRALLLLCLGSGCAVPLAKHCPTCQELELGQRPPVKRGVRTVYVLVPGLLGYGWEWDGAQKEWAGLPDATTLVFSWDPWKSLAQSGDALVRHTDYLLRRLPNTVERVVIVGHSAAGLLLAWAASRVQVPVGLSVSMVSLGAPLAGQGFNPWAEPNLVWTPLPIALGSTFSSSSWAEPAERVSLRVFVTGESDPVMKPHFGHKPGSPSVLPRLAQVVQLPLNVDHNVALATLAKQLCEEERARRQNPRP